MPTNPYLQKPGSFLESATIESITIEAIQWGGINVYYIPRTLNKLDQIYGEDTLSSFDVSIPIEVYLENATGFDGEGSIIAKFGLEIRESASIVVARKRFKQAISSFLPQTRAAELTSKPLEGDLIYDPLTKGLFEIKYVEQDDPFYQTGKKFVWKFTIEKYQYASEQFDTGIPEIDDVFANSFNKNRLDSGIKLSSGFNLLLNSGGLLLTNKYDEDNQSKIKPGGTFGDNSEFKQEFIHIATFDENNPFGDGF